MTILKLITPDHQFLKKTNHVHFSFKITKLKIRNETAINDVNLSGHKNIVRYCKIKNMINLYLSMPIAY